MAVWRLRRWTLLIAAFEYAMGHSFVGMLALAVLAPVEWLAGEPLWRRTTLDRGLLALIVVLLISSLQSEWRTRALASTAQVAVGGPVVVRAVVLSTLREPGFPRLFLGTAAITAAPVAVLASAYVRATPFQRAQVFDLGPNAFGTVLAVALVILIGLSLGGPRTYRLLSLTAAIPVLVGLALTWSRGAWIAAILGLVALAIALPATRLKAALAAFMLAAAAATVVVAPQWKIHAQRFEQTMNDQDPISRPFIWRVAARMVRDHPWVGVGLTAFDRAYPGYHSPNPGGPPTHAHNILLTFAVETGLVGLAAFVVFVTAGVLGAWRWCARTTVPRERAVSATVFAGLVTLLVHQMVDVTVFGSSMAFGLYALLALGVTGSLTVQRARP